MSTLLEASGIRPFEGFDPAHLDPPPDLVVVGNAVPRDNPEALETERRGLSRLSMPEALARFFLADRRPLVVAGTHGKTTTSALAAWVWTCCDRDPGFLVGGVPIDLGASFRHGGGDRFVVEGDEYNAAYFDRGPKFLHYRAETAVLTSVEYDHADLYPSPESLVDAYRRLVRALPESGLLVACGDSDGVREVAREARCQVVLYGVRGDNDLRFVSAPVAGADGVRFAIREADGARHELALGIWGAHNASNALAVWAAARRDGLEPDRIAAALASFRGVRRRQEVVGEIDGVTVVDDFAHHPTAVAETLAALRGRWPGRRLVVCFEPRSLTAGRAFLRDGYLRAFARADRVALAPLYHRSRLEPDQRLDLDRLATELTAAGTPTTTAESVEALAREVLAEAAPGDVVVTMSSGSFEGLPARLVTLLAGRAGVAPGRASSG
jgi:UDP-N-acetylmuramate: L-alanyl-gamma-D-glutamyl-meso-diaminopimelate ligase